MRPMLAAHAEWDSIRYPALASPKLDGIRCIIYQGRALTRNLKPVPNRAVREQLEALCCEGWDGELMLPTPATFQDITSCFMSRDAAPPSDWYYAVFDWCPEPDGVLQGPARARGCAVNAQQTAAQRALRMWRERALTLDPRLRFIHPEIVHTPSRLLELEQTWIEAGYEGVMLRDPQSPYKYGRSTAREGYLLKWKRFADSEAVVTGYVELQRNTNELQVSELGLTKRSKHAAGMVASGLLGALQVTDAHTGVSFEIGSGFTAEQRSLWWQERDWLIGRTCKYKHFAQTGVKDRPRFPVFLGWRDAGDMDE